MDKKITFKKGAEPAIAFPVLAYGVGLISQKIGIDPSPESVAIISGFLYGVYKAICNFFKNRRK